MALGLAHPLPFSLTLSSDSGTSLRKLFSSLYSFPIVNVCGPLDLTRLLTTHPHSCRVHNIILMAFYITGN